MTFCTVHLNDHLNAFSLLPLFLLLFMQCIFTIYLCSCNLYPSPLIHRHPYSGVHTQTAPWSMLTVTHCPYCAENFSCSICLGNCLLFPVSCPGRSFSDTSLNLKKERASAKTNVKQIRHISGGLHNNSTYTNTFISVRLFIKAD